MSRDRDHHHRHSTRLRGYNYSQPGAYFITVCTHRRVRMFGEVVGVEVRPSEAGRMVQSTWDDLPRHFPSITVDALVIMPNHVHGIIILTECPTTSTLPDAETAPLRPPTVGEIVAHLKYKSAELINQARAAPGGDVWQRNYNDRIIRGAASLDAYRRYIALNPARWADDDENVKRR